MRPVRTLHVTRPTLRTIFPLVAAVTILLLAAPAPPARASFHLIEINKILTSHNGDATVQAVELRMQAGGQNLVSGLAIRSYDAAGVLLATHGTFGGSLPLSGAVADRKILCATSGFATTFGITPDLVITPGLPLATGQVSFETVTCFVNAVAYGAVTLSKNGTTSAPAIPSGLAYVLTRTGNNATIPSCPLAEDAAARFAVRSGSTGAPVPFSNKAGSTVNVSSTITGAAETPSAPNGWRAYPNPFTQRFRVQIPDSLIAQGPDPSADIRVYDIRGQLLRRWEYAVHPPGGLVIDWDGRTNTGRVAPTGWYIFDIRLHNWPGAQGIRFKMLRIRGVPRDTYDWQSF